MNVVIIDYGAGNVQSVLFALERLGIKGILSANPKKVRTADKVIFPGVGHANTAMEMLKKAKIDTLIPTLKQPVLGICLGMQLMCERTQEGNTKGLGIFSTTVQSFKNSVKVPQIGWNTISNLKGSLFKGIGSNEYIYMVHSYYAPLCPHTIATCEYERPYSAALGKDNFYGTQFHPEKSSRVGNEILKNFLAL